MNCMPENCCVTASTKHERPGGRAGHGRRIGLGLLMVLPSLPGGLIVLRALTLPRNSPGLPDLCPLHRTTGLWCPLCGGTRATRELMHGDLGAAMGYNPFALVLEVVVMVLVARWLLAWLRGQRRPLVTGREGILLGVALAVFAVVRNLPGMWVYFGPLLGPPG
ncbi:hypothetical protein HMPREF0059_01825 [Actinomyces viscosus C505]|uniref:DUF2752 domain-containing protein n=2 Tax=Actinomycetaceae TaxID=2049 RepID=F2UZF1_ACTVI|nr:hypothetical protein HMPREF0059_01825 [Actinomyces viscosus C505]